MHNALLCVAAAAKMVILVDGESFSRRLQDDYSSVACTTAQPDDSFYCNSIEGMEQSRCTCGSCDQVSYTLKLHDNLDRVSELLLRAE